MWLSDPHFAQHGFFLKPAARCVLCSRGLLRVTAKEMNNLRPRIRSAHGGDEALEALGPAVSVTRRTPGFRALKQRWMNDTSAMCMTPDLRSCILPADGDR